jgi:S1-C subfamily serine protease
VAVAASEEMLSVVRVNVTNQPWDFIRPWGKRAPSSRRAIGAVLPGKRVLVTAELVADANYVELETPAGGLKSVATIETVDYEANLALLKAEDETFLNDSRPLELTEASVGDLVGVWQLESTGTLLATSGSMTSAEVSRYPIDDSPLLVYRATASLQFRDSSFTMPVVKDGKLVGMIMRYDNNAKNLEVIPAPVIRHFLKDAADAPYEGFPRVGMVFANTRDPQFRRFIGLGEQTSGGVYVTEVLKGGAAEKAGIQKGDVVLKVAGEAIDQDGNYSEPNYGKLSVVHLLATKHFSRDKVKFQILRNGQMMDVDVQIVSRSPDDYVIAPYILDRAPRYYVLGGLVLQELSRQYLKEWGPEWMKKGPDELIYLDRQQHELFRDGPKKIILLTSVLPSPATLGYEDLHHLIVTKINDQPLETLADVPEALKKSPNGLHKIEFDRDPRTIFLDDAAINVGNAELMKSYRIPELQRLD